MTTEHICLQCGACCAYYRVSFYWAEADSQLENGVPLHLTEKLDPHRLVMQGTRGRPVRCIALAGKVGACVTCTIYNNRPTPCRELQVAWANGTPSEQCDQARLAWGLPPIPPPTLPPQEKGELSPIARPHPSLHDLNDIQFIPFQPDKEEKR